MVCCFIVNGCSMGLRVCKFYLRLRSCNGGFGSQLMSPDSWLLLYFVSMSAILV